MNCVFFRNFTSGKPHMALLPNNHNSLAGNVKPALNRKNKVKLWLTYSFFIRSMF